MVVVGLTLRPMIILLYFFLLMITIMIIININIFIFILGFSFFHHVRHYRMSLTQLEATKNVPGWNFFSYFSTKEVLFIFILF